MTFISIPTLALYGPVRDDPTYILGPGPDTPAIIGAALEIIVAWPASAPPRALPGGQTTERGGSDGLCRRTVLEAATIFAGVASLLSVVTLRQAGAGADALIAGQALVALHDWTTLLGQGFLPAVNALLLGSLLYRSRLVPRIIPLVGLIGAPLIIASMTATMFGLKDQLSTLSGLAVLPVALWEFSLGVYLVVKGFKPSPVTAGMTTNSTPHTYQDAAV